MASSDLNGDSAVGQDPDEDIGSEALPDIVFCDIHKGKEIERYCETHKCLVCDKCIIGKHNECQHVTLIDKIRTSDPDTAVIDDIKTVTALLQKVKFLLTCQESDRNILAASVKACRDDVERLREKINKRLDEAGKSLDSVLQSHEFRLNTDIETNVTDCKHVIEDLEAQLKQLESCRRLDKSTTYIGHAKAQDDIEEMRNVVRKLETGLEQNRLLEFEPNETLERCLKEKHTLGAIVERNVNDVRKCVSVSKCIDIDVKTGSIIGCTFLPDGTLVFCKYGEDNLYHYTDTFQYRSELTLPSHPDYVTAISDQEVVVTLPYTRKLQFVTTSGGLKLDRTVTLERGCYGIEHCNYKLYVTCWDSDEGGGEVVILDMSGKVLTRIGRMFLGTQYMFDCLDYVCVSTDASRDNVSDVRSGTMTCLGEPGRIIYQSREVIVSPRGVCVGPGGHLAVCGSSSDHVVLLDDRGQVLSELVTSTDGVENPQCVTYRSNDGVLVVGMERGLKVFWLV